LTNAAIGTPGAMPARDNALGLRKPTCLHLRHSAVTPYSVRTNRPLVRTAASSAPHMSDIEYFRRHNRHPRPAFCPLSPGLPGRGFLLGAISRCLSALPIVSEYSVVRVLNPLADRTPPANAQQCSSTSLAATMSYHAVAAPQPLRSLTVI
jgi:hypothetical protein